MVDLSLALYFRRFMRIILSYFKSEGEAPSFVKSFIWRNYQFKVQQVICIWEICCAGFRKIQLIQIYIKSKWTLLHLLVQLIEIIYYNWLYLSLHEVELEMIFSGWMKMSKLPHLFSVASTKTIWSLLCCLVLKVVLVPIKSHPVI